jgi:hypothetical protein
VSTEINNVRNDGAQLIQPLPAEQVATEPATLDVV